MLSSSKSPSLRGRRAQSGGAGTVFFKSKLKTFLFHKAYTTPSVRVLRASAAGGDLSVPSKALLLCAGRVSFTSSPNRSTPKPSVSLAAYYLQDIAIVSVSPTADDHNARSRTVQS